MQRHLREAEPEIRGLANEYQYLCYRFGVRFFEDLIGNVSLILQEMEKAKTKRKASVKRSKKGGAS